MRSLAKAVEAQRDYNRRRSTLMDFPGPWSQTRGERLRAWLTRVRRAWRSAWCRIWNGGHELYVVRHDPARVYQACLLCGHETTGWQMRRPHTIKERSR